MGDPLSLRGIFDIDRIESVLRSFSVRLDQQQTQLSALAASTSHCQQSYDAIKAGVDRALLDIDRRFAQLDSRLHRHESTHDRLDDVERLLESLSRLQRDKADKTAVDESNNRLNTEIEQINRNWDEFNSQKELIFRLDSAQRELVKQLTALQELLSCKVDRVEVPLIENAGERVKAADQFRVEAGPKIDSIESKLEKLESQINSKEERSAVVERMQAIYREFQNRPDKSLIEENLERPLEKLKERYQSLQSLIDSIRPQAIAESLDQARSELRTIMLDETKSIKSQLDCVNSQLASRASVRLVDKKADKTYCEQLVHELSLNCDEKMGSQAVAVEYVKKQILELKRIQNEVDGKLSVSLKFLDWFSTVQLEKQQIGSRVL